MRHIGEITNLPEHLTLYRLHSESITMTRDRGPYNKILKALLHKIYHEEGYNDKDIEIFNNLFLENKKLIIDNSNKMQFNMMSYKFYFPLVIFRFLVVIVGEYAAGKIIHKVKNIIGYIKYCL